MEGDWWINFHLAAVYTFVKVGRIKRINLLYCDTAHVIGMRRYPKLHDPRYAPSVADSQSKRRGVGPWVALGTAFHRNSAWYAGC